MVVVEVVVELVVAVVAVVEQLHLQTYSLFASKSFGKRLCSIISSRNKQNSTIEIVKTKVKVNVRVKYKYQ